jgi:hypothetical protein
LVAAEEVEVALAIMVEVALVVVLVHLVALVVV